MCMFRESCTKVSHRMAFPDTVWVRIKSSHTCWDSCTFTLVHTEGSCEPTIQLLPGQSQWTHIWSKPWKHLIALKWWIVSLATQQFAQADWQLWLYSHSLLVTFKISPCSKYLPWNKRHYLVLRLWLLQLRRLPDAFTWLPKPNESNMHVCNIPVSKSALLPHISLMCVLLQGSNRVPLLILSYLPKYSGWKAMKRPKWGLTLLIGNCKLTLLNIWCTHGVIWKKFLFL